MRNFKENIYRISAILILVSAILYLFIPAVAPWIMAAAVVAFGAVTALSPYPGKSIRGKRLFKFQIFACIFMAAATFLMFKHNNSWILTMMIGAIFLLYSAIMIPKVLEMEK